MGKVEPPKDDGAFEGMPMMKKQDPDRPAHEPCAAPKTQRTFRIRLADYPMLRESAWSIDPEADLTQREAFALYERNWRHIDRQAMIRRERELVDHLTKTVGNGVLLL